MLLCVDDNVMCAQIPGDSVLTTCAYYFQHLSFHTEICFKVTCTKWKAPDKDEVHVSLLTVARECGNF